MSNPGHALASMNQADIAILRTEFLNFRTQYQLAMSSLVGGVRELTELLESKGIVTSDELSGLAQLNIFMSGGFENVW